MAGVALLVCLALLCCGRARVEARFISTPHLSHARALREQTAKLTSGYLSNDELVRFHC